LGTTRQAEEKQRGSSGDAVGSNRVGEIFASLLAFPSDLSKKSANHASKRGDLSKKAFGESTIMETKIVQLRTYQKNIDRYEGLLQTKLSEADRQYIEKRLSEERLAMAMLQFMSPSVPSKAKDALPPETKKSY
jgi:hypothetical protein